MSTLTAAGQTGHPAALDQALAAIAARAPEHDAAGSFPHDAFDLLHELGVLNLTLPTALGGGGAGLAAAAALVQRLGQADPSVALVVSQHLLFHANLAAPSNPWPADVRERVQASSRDGVALINALRVEPELGTPARGGLPATVAERRPGGAGWRLRGHKIYSTGIPRLRWLAVWARTDDAEPLVGTFLVEAGTPGYRVEPTWDHLGMRATRSDDVVFEGADIPFAHAVDVRPVTAFGPPEPSFLAWNNLVIAALYTGVARSARDWLVGYLNERVPTSLGAPLATLPRFQAAVGEIEGLLATNERLVQSTAADVDAGTDDEAAAAAAASGLVKVTATTNAIRAVELGLALIGNPGLSRRNPIERHYRDVLCSRIHTPQDDTVLGAAGKAALTRRND